MTAKAKKAKKDEAPAPEPVEEWKVETTDANVAVVTVNGKQFVLTTDQVHRGRRDLDAAFSLLH